MNVAKNLSLLVLTVATGLALEGCAVKVPAVVSPLPIYKINGSPKAAAAAVDKDGKPIVGTQRRYFSGKESLPPLAKNLVIEMMAYRSLLPDGSDRNDDALKNDALVSQCPDGRPNLDFIQSVEVGIRHKSEPDSQAVVVATYTQTQKGLCGFHLTPTGFDMKDYVGDYTFVVQVTGTMPPAPVTISGYYTAQDYEGL
jgi:hypothetical protein